MPEPEEMMSVADDSTSLISPEPTPIPVGATVVDIGAMANKAPSVMSLGTYDDIGLSFTKSTIGAYITKTPLSRKVWMTVLHNSATPAMYDKGLETVKSFNSYHINTNGWKCIGYHWVISTDGTIYAGRKMELTGAHAGTYGNPGSIGVCLVGNIEGSDKVTQAQKESLAALHYALHKTYYDGAAPNIKFHNDKDFHMNTGCPGKITVPEVMDWVNKYGSPGMDKGTATEPLVYVNGTKIGKGKIFEDSTYMKVRDFEKANFAVIYKGAPDFTVNIVGPKV